MDNELGMQRESETIIQRQSILNEKKIMKTIPAIAREWLNLLDKQLDEERSRIYNALAAHPSDSVRCWAAYIIGFDQRLSLENKLIGIRPRFRC